MWELNLIFLFLVTQTCQIHPNSPKLAKFVQIHQIEAVEHEFFVIMEISLFCGVNDPDAYLRWVQKGEDVFDCEEYSEVQKCRLVSRQFRGRVYF